MFPIKGIPFLLPWTFLPMLCHAELPAQLIMTGKPETVEEMPGDVSANIRNTQRLSGHLSFRWFGDKACRQYIKDHYDEELVDMFDSQKGMYRGDICRSAVLYNEGGFYLDADLEMAVPITSIVDKDTTFASAYSDNGDIFNAIIAAEPKSEVLAENLQEIRRWNRGESKQEGLLGTLCLQRALQTVVHKRCAANLTTMKNTTRWTCGRHNIKMFTEAPLLSDCKSTSKKTTFVPPDGIRFLVLEYARVRLYPPA